MRAAWSIFAERTIRPSCFSVRPAAFGSVMAIGANPAAAVLCKQHERLVSAFDPKN